jgi:hypothetical protein
MTRPSELLPVVVSHDNRAEYVIGPGAITFSIACISGSSKLSTFAQKRAICFMFFSKA